AINPFGVVTTFLSKPGLQQEGGWCFTKQRKLFEAANSKGSPSHPADVRHVQQIAPTAVFQD
ncbi:MAG: hypothetical protein AB1547_13370, partial [Thermodesulfobacteriota bacterium]